MKSTVRVSNRFINNVQLCRRNSLGSREEVMFGGGLPWQSRDIEPANHVDLFLG